MKSSNLNPHEHCVHDHSSSEPSSESNLAFYFQLLFILFILILVFCFRGAPFFKTLGITFVSIFLEALPFMLAGALIGGFVEEFISREALVRFLPKKKWQSILMSAGIGLIFPICECAIVPVVRRLYQKGFPMGAGIAFLLGGPIVNPLVILSTSVAYGYDWSIAAERMVFGYLIAVAIGLLVEVFFDRTSVLAPDVAFEEPSCGCGHCHEHEASSSLLQRIVRSFHHGAADFLDIGRFMIFGAFIAGLLQSLIARGSMAGIAGSSFTSILFMMLLAFILNLCSEADAFLAASFRTTFPLVAQMAFMVLGPMLDIKLILMFFRVFRKRFIMIFSFLTFFTVLLCMLVKLLATV